MPTFTLWKSSLACQRVLVTLDADGVLREGCIMEDAEYEEARVENVLVENGFKLLTSGR